MTFNQYYKETISSKTFIVKASQLYSPQWKIEDTKKNLEKGLLSRTEGPITVSKIGPGKYYLMNGHHRVLQGIISGKTSFEATLDKHIPDMSRTGGGYSNEIKNAVQVVSLI
jgi:hypothetical protein